METSGLSGLIHILAVYIGATGNIAVILYLIEYLIGVLIPAGR